MRFIDTVRFMQSSLSDLANYLPDESFKSLSEFLPVELMRKKGV